MFFVKFVLSLRFPDSQETATLDFRDYRDDLAYATRGFNSAFKDRELKVTLAERKQIQVMMRSAEPFDHLSGRLLTVFSRALYHDCNWKRFSREEGNLFKTTPEQIDLTEEEWDRLSFVPTLDKQVVDLVEMSDDQAIAVLNALIHIQEVGDEQTVLRRKRALVEIKKLLIDAVR